MLEVVLQNYGLTTQRSAAEALGNHGGFSGANLWRVGSPDGTLCVRQWPRAHPSEQHLAWIHSVVQHAFAAGCLFLPRPLTNREGQTFGNYGGQLWEVTPWMPGEADFQRQPAQERLVAAMEALATFHLSTRELKPRRGVPPVVATRLEFSEWLAEGGVGRLEGSVGHVPGPLREVSLRVLAAAKPLLHGVHRVLESCRHELLLQPCLRDVWHDHVLFSGNQVTGIVDQGAMRYDTVAADVSRLLASLVPGDEAKFLAGLRAYERLHPLSPGERDTVQALTLASVPLAGLQWVRWLGMDRRTFADQAAVLKRMGSLLAQLEGGSCGGP